MSEPAASEAVPAASEAVPAAPEAVPRARGGAGRARGGAGRGRGRGWRAVFRADGLGAADGDAAAQFLRTETGSAAVLAAATVAALIWANIGSLRMTRSGRPGCRWPGRPLGVTHDLRGWVNSGLMTFFFLVVGLEARREFDMGELRERRRLTLPLLAGLGGMIVPIAIYLAFNAGRPSAHGWGTAMSTDTAFALGMLALVGRRLPDRVRTYLLTFSVVDDLAGLAVIAIFYSGAHALVPLLSGSGILAVVLAIRAARRPVRPGLLPARGGRLGGVLQVGRGPGRGRAGHGPAHLRLPGARGVDLERATDAFRLFREQPTAELAAVGPRGGAAAISPNERLAAALPPVDQLRRSCRCSPWPTRGW